MFAYDNPKNNINFAVTTSLRAATSVAGTAMLIAAELKVPYIKRCDEPVDNLLESLNLNGLIIVSSTRISYRNSYCEFFFHPGLAKLRIKEIRDGKTDQMIRAMSLQRGYSVLDCTLGLGTDAIVASYIAGGEGRVAGLENSTVISCLVRRGLSTYQEPQEDIASAMRRVKVIEADYREFLSKLPAGSFDIVYFDPMFRAPGCRSPAINALRPLASTGPVDVEAIEMAKKVASRRIVLKERRGSEEFKRLGFEKITGGRNSTVAYGIIDLTGAV